MHHNLSEAIKYWDHISPVVKHPGNQQEYRALVSQLDELLDIVKSDESHKLMGLVDVISYLVQAHEEENFKPPETKGVDALKFLMQAHALTQVDFPEIGSQGVVSEILSGKRDLNLRQIKALSTRFSVTPSTFIDD